MNRKQTTERGSPTRSRLAPHRVFGQTDAIPAITRLRFLEPRSVGGDVAEFMRENAWPFVVNP